MFPIGVNPTTRTSRLFRSKRQYVRRSAGTIWVYAMHKTSSFLQHSSGRIRRSWPHTFRTIRVVLPERRWRRAYPVTHIVGAVCLLVSVQMLMLGLLADLLRTNRVITERVLRRVRNIELSLGTYGNTEEESDSDFETLFFCVQPRKPTTQQAPPTSWKVSPQPANPAVCTPR